MARGECDDPFADPNQVLSLHLRISRADWSALVVDDPAGSGCDARYPYYQVEFRCGDDDSWISIGARKKRGDQRGMDNDQKPPI